MKIDLKKIFCFSSSKNTVIDNVKIIRSTKRLKTISLQIKNGQPIIFCPSYTKDSYLRSIIKKKQLWIKKKINVEKSKKEDITKLENIVKDSLNDSKFLSIGEIGLDFFISGYDAAV